MFEIEIREIDPATDMGRVVAIEKKSFNAPWRRREFLDAMECANVTGLAAFHTGAKCTMLVGYALYARDRDEKTVQVIVVAVHSWFRRHRIGSRLLDRIATDTGKNFSRLICGINEYNDVAIKWLRALGFRAYETIENRRGENDYWFERKELDMGGRVIERLLAGNAVPLCE